MDRSDYDSNWLNPGAAVAGYTKFTHRPMAEVPNIRDQVKPHLGAAIVDHHTHRNRVAHLLAELGYAATAAEIAARLPGNDRTRKGNFGEVVASEHLLQRHAYRMPVFKLRFRDHPNLPMRGEDIVAFVTEADGTITRVCVGEAKTLVAFTAQTIKSAHERLEKTYRPTPETLHMIAEILYDRGEKELAREMDRILQRLAAKTIQQENWIFVITGDAPADPFGSLQSLQTVVPNLNCVNLFLPDLSQLVTDLFDHPHIAI